jgi:phytoene synthase
MQLTNICRDVAEDERRGRVYLSEDVLGTPGMPTSMPERSAVALSEVLRRADDFYRSGDAGIVYLPVRCAVAIRAARLIYAEIGRVIARRRYDVLAGRAVVSRRRKLLLLAKAAFGTWVRFALKRLGSGWTKSPPRIIPLPFDLPMEEWPGDDLASQPIPARALGTRPHRSGRAKVPSEDLPLGGPVAETQDSKLLRAVGAPS